MCFPAFVFLSSMYRALIELALTIVVLIVVEVLIAFYELFWRAAR